MHSETKFVGFRINKELWAAFKAVAQKRHATASELLRAYIRKEVERC
jgi:uncharacterized protein YdbL (DUF1318 family)